MLIVRAYRVTRPRGLHVLLKEQSDPIAKFYLEDAEWYERQRLCRTYDLLVEKQWCGFFSLSNHTLKIQATAQWMSELMRKKKIPREPPGILLSQLFICGAMRGKGYGAEALWHAIRFCLKSLAGCRILVVDPFDDQTKNFYKKFGWYSAHGTGKKMYFDLLRYEDTMREVRRLYPTESPTNQLKIYGKMETAEPLQSSLI